MLVFLFLSWPAMGAAEGLQHQNSGSVEGWVVDARCEAPIQWVVSCQLSRAQKAYHTTRAGLMSLFGSIGPSPVSFRTMRERPIIVPWRALLLKWRGEELNLRGYIDVYMTMII